MLRNNWRPNVSTLLTTALFATLLAPLFLVTSVSAETTTKISKQDLLRAQYRAWMVEARQKYPYRESVDKMYKVMMCESSGNARAAGGGGRWLGLFQYSPSTWAGKWNPYRNESIWDAKAQIFATAKAWSIGMQSHWSCYYKN